MANFVDDKTDGYWNFVSILERIREIEHLPLIDEEIPSVLAKIEASIKELQYIQSVLQTHIQNKQTHDTNHTS
jgi:hypothetical protein